MKRIAFYRSEFRLCEWPEEPEFGVWSNQEEKVIYFKAVASAMENGIAFADQEGVKQFIFKTTNEIRGTMLIWQPKDGDNWPAPEEAEIRYQIKYLIAGWTDVDKTVYDDEVTEDLKHKVAVLRSESMKEHLPNNLSGEKKGIEELKTKYGIATSQRNRIRDRVKVSIPRIISIIEDGKYDRAVKELRDLLDVIKKDKKQFYEK